MNNLSPRQPARVELAPAAAGALLALLFLLLCGLIPFALPGDLGIRFFFVACVLADWYMIGIAVRIHLKRRGILIPARIAPAGRAALAALVWAVVILALAALGWASVQMARERGSGETGLAAILPLTLWIYLGLPVWIGRGLDLAFDRRRPPPDPPAPPTLNGSGRRRQTPSANGRSHR